MAHSPRMSQVLANGVELCVEERGDPGGPALLFIMGLACQMTVWPESLLDDFADKGYRVVRFDNRDVGLSQKIKASVRSDIRWGFIRHKLGRRNYSSYTLFDMARDAHQLLEQLNIEKAHVVGASMGGMIAQILAAEHASSVRSLTTVMSSTNHPKLPMPKLELLYKLSRSGPKGKSKDVVVERWVNFWQAIGSNQYPSPINEIRQQVSDDYDRCFSPGGTIRQIQAILATGNLTHIARRIHVPTLVVHGSDDPLLRPRCGLAIHNAVQSSRFHMVEGMAHDLPDPLIPQISGMIHKHICQYD